MSQQSQSPLPPTSPYSIHDEESPSHESDNENNDLFGSSQPLDNEYIDNGLLAGDIFVNDFNFNDAWAPEEEFSFESPSPFLSQRPGSPQELPPRNQQAGNTSRPPPNERNQTVQNTFHLGDSDPFEDFLDFTPPPPSATPRSPRAAVSGGTTRRSSVVDLTGSPQAEMPPTTRERKRKERSSGSNSQERPTKLAKLPHKQSNSSKPKEEDAELIDLVDIEDGMQYKDFQAKQQAEAIKQQNLDEATRPVKLAEFQCIICMDNPTDLTVTHCGKSSYCNPLLCHR